MGAKAFSIHSEKHRDVIMYFQSVWIDDRLVAQVSVNVVYEWFRIMLQTPTGSTHEKHAMFSIDLSPPNKASNASKE